MCKKFDVLVFEPFLEKQRHRSRGRPMIIGLDNAT